MEAWLIGRLKEEIALVASEGLREPAARDQFEFGRLHGMVGGLSRALELIEGKLNERADEDDEGDRYGTRNKRTR